MTKTREQIIKLAETQMRKNAPQYTFKDKTAFLYAGQVEGDGRYIVGLLETDPKEGYHYCTAHVTSDDNSLGVIGIGLDLLGLPGCSFELWSYINKFKPLDDIRIVPVTSELESVLETCIEKQSRINAYERGISYLNEQVRGGKSK
ncbi:hypothetical protein HYU07_03470 [Candidatus Woesearchaeota archaeon]|nr:hypothetical protein [Candidatus Woesearchaeota archaeon]